MSLRILSRCNCTKNKLFIISRGLSETSAKPPLASSSTAPPPKSTAINTNVAGLSGNVMKKTSQGERLGPGASKDGDYKVPEYYLYQRFSYHEAEIELAQFRCPQPSAKK